MLSFRANDSDKPDSLIRITGGEDSGVEEAWRALKKRAWIRGGVDRKEMGLDRTE